jgi:hypothetical protein
VTLGLGEQVTCTFVNNDNAPSLTLVKEVINDNGGTAVAGDWTLSAAGYLVNDKPQIGTHTLSESGPTGYTQTSLTCSNAQGPVTSVTLGLGEQVTCTFVNNDNAPSLTLNKIVVNNNGGTSMESAWSLTATGPTTITGLGAAGDADVMSDASFDQGTYTLSESTGPSGYIASAWSCVGGTQNGSSVTLGLGESATCTITNDDQPGHLIVRKVTDPASDTTTQFSMTISGTYPVQNPVQNVVGGGSIDHTVDAGTYSVTETVPAGWDKTGDTCQGIAVANGETKECTITNTKRGSITIVKDAQPNDSTDFNFTSLLLGGFTLDDDAGVQEILDSAQWSNTKTFANLSANNTYSVTEIEPNIYWTLNNVSCVYTGTTNAYTFTRNGNTASIALLPGADVTCTFVNVKNPTRTQGFWQTHTAYTSYVFGLPSMQKYVGVNTPVALGTHKGQITNTQSNNQSQLFGAFYSNIAKKTTGKGNAAQRTEIDKARMQLLQQLVAAKLNCAAFGCNTTVSTMISGADAAYAGTNVSSILSYAGQLDVYNNSGDTIILNGTPGKATPKTSQDWANLSFWDAP